MAKMWKKKKKRCRNTFTKHQSTIYCFMIAHWTHLYHISMMKIFTQIFVYTINVVNKFVCNSSPFSISVCDFLKFSLCWPDKLENNVTCFVFFFLLKGHKSINCMNKDNQKTEDLDLNSLEAH